MFIVSFGIFLRVHTISSKELWYDEAFSAEIVKNSYTEVFRLSALDVHPPLYYFVLKVFTLVFGLSEAALRYPSVIFGVLLIPLVYLLVTYLTANRVRALVAALVVATNPFLVTYSREARSYALLSLLTVLVFFFAVKAIKENKYVPLAITMPFLFLTHYISIFMLTPIAIYLLVLNRNKFIYFLPLLVVIVLWLPNIIAGTSSTGLKWVPDFTTQRIPQTVHAFILGTDTNKPRVAPPLNPFPINTNVTSIIIFAVAITIILLSQPSKESLLLLLCGTVPIVLVALCSKFLGINLYVERFMIGYGTLLLIYLVLATPRVLILTPYICVCVYLVLTFVPTNIGYRELANYPINKPIVMTDAGDYITAKYYLDNIKLQPGNWEDWVIIHDEDKLDENTNIASYYLVSRVPIEQWEATFSVGDFYFYDWYVR